VSEATTGTQGHDTKGGEEAVMARPRLDKEIEALFARCERLKELATAAREKTEYMYFANPGLLGNSVRK
jgi:hypothetical protein